MSFLNKMFYKKRTLHASVKRLTQLFVAFTVFMAVKHALAEACRCIFNRDSVFTYAQAGEDRIIEQILVQFLGLQGGYYVDVGANEPISKSNTFRLYERGWFGLSIDGNQTLINKHKKLRPRDRAVCAVVSREESDVIFMVASDPALSHIATVNEVTQGKSIEKLTCATTLETLFAKNDVPKRFELLSIDVEGADFDVLRSFDLSRYRPTLIVIEMACFEIENARQNAIYLFLVGSGYKMVGYSGRNGFFLDNASLSTRVPRSKSM